MCILYTSLSINAARSITLPIVITAQSASATICLGTSKTLTVAATSICPPIAYQWYRNGVVIPGATSSSYIISNASASNTGTFFCNLTASCGTNKTTHIVISLSDPVQFTTHPQSQTVCKGTTVSFTANASGPSGNYQWFFNGSPINGANTQVLTITNSQNINAGNYTCGVSGICGTIISNIAVLQVCGKIAISQQPVSITQCINTPASLSVETAEGCTYAFQWYKMTPNNACPVTYQPVAVPGATSSSYFINSLQPDNSGQYFCKITGPCGFKTSAIATIKVINSSGGIGTIDQTFYTGSSNLSLGWIETMAVQEDGKILCGGYFTSYNGYNVTNLMRLNADGTWDNSFLTTSSLTSIRDIKVQPDCKILVTGYFNTFNGVSKNKLVRLNPDGSLDNSFDAGTCVDGQILDMAIQSDGKIILAGYFNSYQGHPAISVCRINSNGSYDPTFNSMMPNPTNIFVIKLIGSRIFLGGNIDSYGGLSTNGIVALNNNGSVDVSFSRASALFNIVMTIEVDQNSNILIGGSCAGFSPPNTQSNYCTCIDRLLPNGQHDPTFQTTTGMTLTSNYGDPFQVNKILLSDDGKIIASGIFDKYNGYTSNSVVRILQDGTPDNTFTSPLKFNSNVTQMTMLPDNKLIVAGDIKLAVTPNIKGDIYRINLFDCPDSPYDGPPTGRMASSLITEFKNEKNLSVKIYPNPAHSYLNIETEETEDYIRVSIYTLEGRSVQQEEIKGKRTIDVSSLTPGMYVVKVSTSAGELLTAKKIIVE